MNPSPPVIRTLCPGLRSGLRRSPAHVLRRTIARRPSGSPRRRHDRDAELLRRADELDERPAAPLAHELDRDDQPLGAGELRRQADAAAEPPRDRGGLFRQDDRLLLRLERREDVGEPVRGAGVEHRDDPARLDDDLGAERPLEPAHLLLDQIELEGPGARGRRDQRERHDQRAARRQVGRQRAVLAVDDELTLAPARAEADSAAPPPRLAAEVLDAHVDGLQDAAAQPGHFLHQRQARVVFLERGARPVPVDLLPRRLLDPRHCRHGRRRGEHVRDQQQILPGHLGRRRIDQLRQVERLVHRPSGDALAGVEPLVALRLRLARLARVQQRVEVVERRLQVPRRSDRGDRDVRLRRERDDPGVVQHETGLVVGPPRPRGQIPVRRRVQPAPREPVVRDVARARQLLERVEQPLARHLVVVDRQHPVAGALRVDPGERPVDRLLVRVAQQARGDRRERRLGLRPGAVVDGDDDLVRDPAEQRRASRQRGPRGRASCS